MREPITSKRIYFFEESDNAWNVLQWIINETCKPQALKAKEVDLKFQIWDYRSGLDFQNRAIDKSLIPPKKKCRVKNAGPGNNLFNRLPGFFPPIDFRGIPWNPCYSMKFHAIP